MRRAKNANLSSDLRFGSLCFLNLYLLPRLRRAGIVLVLLIGCSLAGCAAPSGQLFVEAPLPSDSEEFGLVKQAKPLRSIGKVKVLVIFAKFKDEKGDWAPDYAEKLLDPDYEGSFAHFFRTMSFGQLEVGGAVLPKRYSSDRPGSAYLARPPGGTGSFGEFVREILGKVDADVDLSQFDSDGPDGIPNSGDDDGRVDYVLVNVLSAPTDFITKGADGISQLGGFTDDYSSAMDTSANGKPMRISYKDYHGAIQEEGNFAQTVGVMAHEFGHGLGLPDLYDKTVTPPEEDSGGIGKWGLMGWGAHGWGGNAGPVPFCAWSLEQLGWIGRDNERLVEVREDQAGLAITDLFRQGHIFKIILRNHFTDLHGYYPLFSQEYLLLEHRVRGAHYYDLNLPAEGLLVWHVRAAGPSNDDETNKMVDLVCADGLYADAGYPLGRAADPHSGRDNLDFWAHGDEYKGDYGGNLGDSTDPFDGVHYTRLDLRSNPSIDIGRFLSAASTGPAVTNMRRDQDAMVVDIAVPRWAGTLTDSVHWVGDILIDGNLTVAPGAKLTIYSQTRVRIAGSDPLESRRDPRRCELYVEGDLQIHTRKFQRAYVEGATPQTKSEMVKPQPVVFEAMVPGDTWYGIFSAESGQVDAPDGSFELRDTEYGFLDYSDLSNVATVIDEAPVQESATPFALLPNYPNPFDQSTTIPYTLAAMAPVRLVVYNSLGQTVRTLVDDDQSAGRQDVVWNGQDESGQPVASGLYLYRLEIPEHYSANGKMMLLGSGMAQLSALDSTLRAQGSDWSLVADDMTRASAPVFGFVAEPSMAQAAFTTGELWTKLNVLKRYSQDPQGARKQAQHLGELLGHFDPTPAQRRAVESSPHQLRAGCLLWRSPSDSIRSARPLPGSSRATARKPPSIFTWASGCRPLGLLV